MSERVVLAPLGDVMLGHGVAEVYGGEPRCASAVPIALDDCHTRLANQDDASWIRARFASVCAALGTTVHSDGARFVVDLPAR